MEVNNFGKRGEKYTFCRSAAVSSFIVLLALLSGCSATSLRCGVQDDNSSYVELINVPQDLSSQARHFTDLCGFAYEKVSE